jgi:beta-lactam-binding protein with PASTA domain
MEFRPGNDPSKPDGIILEQSPNPGETVAPRSVVRLVVNRLTAGMLTTVPNVSGMEEAEARRTIEKEGLKVSVERDRGGRKGVVYDQSPAPGVKVPPGTEVKVVIGS